MKESAIVEVCYKTKEHWFRCPKCGSLNINRTVTLEKCPDCGERLSVPQVTLCNC